MEWFLGCLLGFAVNLDNFMIGLSLGMRRQRVSLQANVVMALLTGGMTFCSMRFAQMLSHDLAVWANLVGALLLIAFGVFCIFHNAEEGEQGYGVECWSEIFILGVLMAINCIPPAFSAGAMGMNSAVVTVSSFVCAFVCMGVSSQLGSRLRSARRFAHLDQAAAGLLILIGFLEVLMG